MSARTSFSRHILTENAMKMQQCSPRLRWGVDAVQSVAKVIKPKKQRREKKESKKRVSGFLKVFGHGSAQVGKVDRFRDVVAKAGRHAFLLDVRHDICR